MKSQSLVKISRNVLLVALLWAADGLSRPEPASAMWCNTTMYFENWTGRCTPDASEACGYYNQECMWYCYSHYGGQLCSSDWMWCQQEWNEGAYTWCLTNGWCQCRVYS
jgi:hypothetical protein